jgi:hypothetical protein
VHTQATPFQAGSYSQAGKYVPAGSAREDHHGLLWPLLHHAVLHIHTLKLTPWLASR